MQLPQGLWGRDGQAPPLWGQQLGGRVLYNTCLSPWPDVGRRERKLQLHHQLGRKAEMGILRPEQWDPLGQQLGWCWGHKGRIIPSGTRLINGTFISPPHPTQPTHTHGVGYLKTQHTAGRDTPQGPPGLCLDTVEGGAPSSEAAPRPGRESGCSRTWGFFDGAAGVSEHSELSWVLCVFHRLISNRFLAGSESLWAEH